MEKIKKVLFKTVLIFSFSMLPLSPIYGQSGVDEVKSDFLVQGYEAYKNKDWVSASLFLRKAVTENPNAVDSTWYMLILSQMATDSYDSAVKDCDTFISKFPDSQLLPYITYQKGRALHQIGQNDRAVMVLSDFCHQNPDSPMYASGLFWMAECFYDDYNYEMAESLYSQVISEYPDDEKAAEAEQRLSEIRQSEREQKLLYLLKMTGEEYLSAREYYERLLAQRPVRTSGETSGNSGNAGTYSNVSTPAEDLVSSQALDDANAR
ncbi:MAG: tetratricopeptide repeat protein, partial [Treponema sp.]|nr:tetratricopeptide repeat protein [Treponema sp.]